jgi:ElaB/YqjD/DUF883 family membrane-anchored ribosome-binding protein
MVRKTVALLSLVGCVSLALPAHAQHLYNKERDDLAQEAQKLAEELETASVFDKQLKNLGLLSKQDVAIHFLGARRATRAAIDRLTTWKDVGTVVDRVGLVVAAPATISADDAAEARKQLEGKIKEARDALEALKKAAVAPDDPAVSGLLDHLGDLKSLQDYFDKIATKLPSGTLPASLIDENKELGAALGRLTELYKRSTERLQAIRKLSADLEALKVPLQTVVLQTLLVDEEHWKNVGAINARRQAEQSEVVELLSDFGARTKRLGLRKDPAQPSPLSDEAITVTVTRLIEADDREAIADVFLTLYVATALVARGATPGQLAELRLAQEEHRYSIRRSTAVARAYEVTISTGTKRLALYHKGGIKPELVAQVVQAIATLAIPPAIMAK